MKKSSDNDSILGLRGTEEKARNIEGGVLDTIQVLKKEKIHRRDKVADMIWYRFLVIMLWIGGSSTLVLMSGTSYLAGRASAPVAASVVATPSAPTATTPSSEEMTTAVIKKALAETREILSSANGLRGEVKAMAQAELPPTPPPPASPSLPTSIKPEGVEQKASPAPRTDAELRNEALKQSLRQRYGIRK